MSVPSLGPEGRHIYEGYEVLSPQKKNVGNGQTSRPMSGPRWWPTTSLSWFACDQAEASAALSRSGKLAIASPSSCPRLRRQALSGADCTFDQAELRKYIHKLDRNIAPNSQSEGKTARLWTETS